MRDTFWLVSGNVTGASSAKVWLEHECRDAEVAVAQEHKMLEAEVSGWRWWLRRRGWKACMEPAVISDGGGRSSGTLVAAKGQFGLRSFDCDSFRWSASHEGFGPAPAGRIAGAWFGGYARGGVTIFSVYLVVGAGLRFAGSPLENPNWRLLGALQRATAACGTPWAIGGDWNLSPSELEDSGWVRLVRGALFAPDEATCLPPPSLADQRAGSTTDYWAVDRRLASLVDKVEVLRAHSLRTHLPVRLVLRGGPRREQVHVLKAPKPFSAVRPVGPDPMPVQGAMDVGQPLREHLNSWYEAVEEELCNIHGLDGQDRSKHCGRAGGPSLVLRPTLGPVGCSAPAGCQAGRVARVLVSLLVAWRRASVSAHARIAGDSARAIRQCRGAWCRAGLPDCWRGRLRSFGCTTASIDWATRATAWEAELGAFADEQARRQREAGEHSWRAWVASSFEGGAAAAHRFSRRVDGPACDPICEPGSGPASPAQEVGCV